jgi:hypothetical protein
MSLRHIHAGKRLKPPSASRAVRSSPRAAHVAVHAVCVGPVRLHRDRVEVPFDDEPARDLRAFSIELVGSVGRFADQDEARVADALEEES